MPSKCTDLIGITMGCPVGIGPEIILKYLCQSPSVTSYRPVVVGVPWVFARCAAELDLDVDIILWQPGDILVEQFSSNQIVIYCPERLKDVEFQESALTWGAPTPTTGKMMAMCIEECFSLIQKGELTAMVTCPISKAALKMAGYPYPGHTEMLAQMSGSSDFAMMMAGHTLRVTLVTIHVGLQDVSRLLSIDKITRLIRQTGNALKNDFSIPEPRMAVAALNPHAGEEGMFGDEETRLIEPAILEALQEGWDISGPFPPDTVFTKAIGGDFDAVICMYHDQGLIPFKLLHFEDGVNVTIGLNIVRTSVDHGTAYDIAGKGIASPLSLAAAYEMAADIVNNRRNLLDGP